MDSPDLEMYRDPEVVRADDPVDEIVRTDTARKMLSIFRQMEENASKEELPDGPKPLKCFTPPPEDKFAKASASDSDEEEDEQEDSEDNLNPNYVRASDKVFIIFIEGELCTSLMHFFTCCYLVFQPLESFTYKNPKNLFI